MKLRKVMFNFVGDTPTGLIEKVLKAEPKNPWIRGCTVTPGGFDVSVDEDSAPKDYESRLNEVLKGIFKDFPYSDFQPVR